MSSDESSELVALTDGTLLSVTEQNRTERSRKLWNGLNDRRGTTWAKPTVQCTIFISLAVDKSFSFIKVAA